MALSGLHLLDDAVSEPADTPRRPELGAKGARGEFLAAVSPQSHRTSRSPSPSFSQAHGSPRASPRGSPRDRVSSPHTSPWSRTRSASRREAGSGRGRVGAPIRHRLRSVPKTLSATQLTASAYGVRHPTPSFRSSKRPSERVVQQAAGDRASTAAVNAISATAAAAPALRGIDVADMLLHPVSSPSTRSPSRQARALLRQSLPLRAAPVSPRGGRSGDDDTWRMHHLAALEAAMQPCLPHLSTLFSVFQTYTGRHSPVAMRSMSGAAARRFALAHGIIPHVVEASALDAMFGRTEAAQRLTRDALATAGGFEGLAMASKQQLHRQDASASGLSTGERANLVKASAEQRRQITHGVIPPPRKIDFLGFIELLLRCAIAYSKEGRPKPLSQRGASPMPASQHPSSVTDIRVTSGHDVGHSGDEDTDAENSITPGTPATHSAGAENCANAGGASEAEADDDDDSSLGESVAHVVDHVSDIFLSPRSIVESTSMQSPRERAESPVGNAVAPLVAQFLADFILSASATRRSMMDASRMTDVRVDALATPEVSELFATEQRFIERMFAHFTGMTSPDDYSAMTWEQWEHFLKQTELAPRLVSQRTSAMVFALCATLRSSSVSSTAEQDLDQPDAHSHVSMSLSTFANALALLARAIFLQPGLAGTHSSTLQQCSRLFELLHAATHVTSAIERNAWQRGTGRRGWGGPIASSEVTPSPLMSSWDRARPEAARAEGACSSVPGSFTAMLHSRPSMRTRRRSRASSIKGLGTKAVEALARSSSWRQSPGAMSPLAAKRGDLLPGTAKRKPAKRSTTHHSRRLSSSGQASFPSARIGPSRVIASRVCSNHQAQSAWEKSLRGPPLATPAPPDIPAHSQAPEGGSSRHEAADRPLCQRSLDGTESVAACSTASNGDFPGDTLWLVTQIDHENRPPEGWPKTDEPARAVEVRHALEALAPQTPQSREVTHDCAIDALVDALCKPPRGASIQSETLRRIELLTRALESPMEHEGHVLAANQLGLLMSKYEQLCQARSHDQSQARRILEERQAEIRGILLREAAARGTGGEGNVPPSAVGGKDDFRGSVLRAIEAAARVSPCIAANVTAWPLAAFAREIGRGVAAAYQIRAFSQRSMTLGTPAGESRSLTRSHLIDGPSIESQHILSSAGNGETALLPSHGEKQPEALLALYSDRKRGTIKTGLAIGSSPVVQHPASPFCSPTSLFAQHDTARHVARLQRARQRGGSPARSSTRPENAGGGGFDPSCLATARRHRERLSAVPVESDE